MNEQGQLKHILIVEDDIQSLQIAGELFKHYGVEVDLVAHVRDATQLMNTNNYDVIIIDLTLPEISGWELLHNIQGLAKHANTPVIAITAFHSPVVEKNALDAGFIAYFSKPIDVYSFYENVVQIVKSG